MPRFEDKYVVIAGCTVVWDGVTRPETDPQTGKTKYTLKVVVPPQSPDLAEYGVLAQETLQASKWRGTLPPGALMPIGQAKPGEFKDLFPGHAVISAKSWFPPDVYDEAGALLDPMQYAASLYPGQRVDIMVHCYDYDKMGNQGIAAGLDGLRIVASANAPKVDIGTGGANTAAAFGAPATAGQSVPQTPAPMHQAPVAPAPAGQPVPQTPATPAYPTAVPPTAVPPAPAGQPVAPAPTGNIVGYDPQTGAPIYG